MQGHIRQIVRHLRNRATVMVSTKVFHRGLRFLAVGTLSTLIYAIVAVLLATFTRLPASICSLIAYCAATGFSFTGHRLFTFHNKDNVARTAYRFAGVNLLAYIFAVSIPWIVSDILGYAAMISIALVCIVIPVFNFVLLTIFVFKSSPAEPQQAL